MRIIATEELTPWRTTKLACGIGHVVSGKVRTVRHQCLDREGFEYWEESPTTEYEPDRCVVCGLYINKEQS